MSESQVLQETINVPNAGIGVDQYPPQSAQNQASPGVSNFVDGSGHIFSMYLEMATEEDKKIVENWKADADGILIFTGLFSAAVALFISVSIQDLQQNRQDTSNFYLANIYQVIADPNSPNTSSPSPPSPPPFSPPNHAVWVNALWFLSLVISLTCALLATLLQQWARRYLKITQSRYSPHKRARIRAFFSEGVEKCLLPWAVEALPTLLHISLFLFFTGLVVFLCNINLTVFKLVLSWVSLCTVLYGCITCMPIIRHDSPYNTPLSLPVWHIVTGTLFLVYRFLRWFNWTVRYRHNTFLRFHNLVQSRRKSLLQGMQKTAEETALSSPSEIDTRAFMWTFDCLDEDHELESFFSGLPGFRSSSLVCDPLRSLTEEEKWKLSEGLRGLLDRTFLSDLLPPPVKNRRAMICAKAVDPEQIPYAFSTLYTILVQYQYSGPLATAIAKVLRSWRNNMNEDNTLHAQVIIHEIIARMQPRGDSWYIIVSNELGFSEAVLRAYAAHGDSLKLAILIHVVRQYFIHFKKMCPYWQHGRYTALLQEASKFDVQNTSPELQHEFCALWNHIIGKAQDDNNWRMSLRILGPIRDVYLALHQDTDSGPVHFSASTGDCDDILSDPTSYPVCKVPGHHPDSTSHIHYDHPPTTFTPAVPHDHDNIALLPSLTSPDPPRSPTYAPLPVDKTLTDALLLDNQISVPVSVQPMGQTTTENYLIPTTSRSPVTACMKRGIVDPSSRTMHLAASIPLTSSPPLKSNESTSSQDEVAVVHTELSCAPSDDLNDLSSLSPPPVLDDVLPTESPSSTIEPAAGGEGSAKAGLSMEMDASHSTSAIRKDITATEDLPPQLPSLFPVTDIGTDGSPERSLGTEHLEHQRLDPARSPYDIV
ncbi:hypothetical protein V8E53_001727 [Lactarius tabidus]